MKKPTIYTYRRILQIGVALSFILIPFLNQMRISFVFGNFLSFNLAGLPLADPLAVLQISLKNFYLAPDLMIGAGIALFIALILGTAFCSWICPFGLLSELFQQLGSRLRPATRNSAQSNQKGFRLKGFIFVSGFIGFLLFSTTPVLNQLSLPAWYSRIFQFYFVQHHFSLAIFFLLMILIIEAAAGKRLWCRYICPQAVLLVVAKLINPFRLKIRFDKEKCICKGTSDPCKNACTLSLDPKKLAHSMETECNNCGDCIVACKKRGQAIDFHFT